MFYSPMLLQYAKDNLPYNDPNNIVELKLDGFRLIDSNTDKVNIYTRHNNNVTSKFPELKDNPTPNNTILDGELIVTDINGKPDFEAMMARFKSKRDQTPVTFCAFDIIQYKGRDVTKLPLLQRKEILQESFIENDYYKKSKYIEGEFAIDYFNLVKQQGLEGVVIKKKTSKYEVDRRSWSWQKVINWTEVDVFISGFSKIDFGWLVSIKSAEGKYRYVGVVEFGVSPDQKAAFNSVKRKMIVNEDKEFYYLDPLIKAKVKIRNWTKKGNLRSPVFVEFIL